jgi:hypothetical protein
LSLPQAARASRARIVPVRNNLKLRLRARKQTAVKKIIITIIGGSDVINGISGEVLLLR